MMGPEINNKLKIEWESMTRRIYDKSQDDLKSNKEYQEYLLEKYTTLPAGDRERNEMIETAALNMHHDNNGVLRHTENNKIANESDITKLEHNIQKQMLANNKLMEEEVVKWDGSHFVLKPYREWMRIHEDRLKTELKPTPFNKEDHQRMIDETMDTNENGIQAPTQTSTLPTEAFAGYFM